MMPDTEPQPAKIDLLLLQFGDVQPLLPECESARCTRRFPSRRSAESHSPALLRGAIAVGVVLGAQQESPLLRLVHRRRIDRSLFSLCVINQTPAARPQPAVRAVPAHQFA